jgi:hypothetical protein
MQGVLFFHEHPGDAALQLPHALPNSMLLEMLKRLSIKSIFIGFACSINALSTTYLNPLIS